MSNGVSAGSAWRVAAPLAVVCLSLACGSGSGSGTGDGDGDGRDCLDDDGHLVIEETEDSYHEMVVCGGLAQRLNENLYQVLVTSFLDAQGIRVPDGYRYDGAGHYTTGDEITTMSVEYQFGQDYAAAAEGDLVVPNLFDLDSYLLGVTLDVDLPSGDILVRWRSTGPLVELLGRGDDPPNPIRYSVDALREPTHLGRLRMVARVEVVDPRESATVTYSLATEPTVVDAMMANGKMTFDLIESRTIGADGSTLTADSSGVQYNDGPGTLNGDVSFSLRDGATDADGTLIYLHSSSAEIVYECL